VVLPRRPPPFLAGGALTEGGNVYAWLNHTLDLAETPDLETALLQREPDAHGLTFLPLIAGERSPGWVGDARAAVSSISLATTSLDILQAGMESVLLRIGRIYELLRPYLPEAVDGSPAAALSAVRHTCSAPSRRTRRPGTYITGAKPPPVEPPCWPGKPGGLPNVSAATAPDRPRHLRRPQRHVVFQAALARQKTVSPHIT
jgi:gluconokinase